MMINSPKAPGKEEKTAPDASLLKEALRAGCGPMLPVTLLLMRRPWVLFQPWKMVSMWRLWRAWMLLLASEPKEAATIRGEHRPRRWWGVMVENRDEAANVFLCEN